MPSISPRKLSRSPSICDKKPAQIANANNTSALPKIQKLGTPKAEIDAKLEEARRLFFVGITRVKASAEHVGSLFITYPREMGANSAKGLNIPFTKVNNGMAQLTPSMFIQELGPAAPAPVAGKVT